EAPPRSEPLLRLERGVTHLAEHLRGAAEVAVQRPHDHLSPDGELRPGCFLDRGTNDVGGSEPLGVRRDPAERWVKTVLPDERRELLDEHRGLLVLAAFSSSPDALRERSRELLEISLLSTELDGSKVIGERAVQIAASRPDLAPGEADAVLVRVRRAGLTLCDEHVRSRGGLRPASTHVVDPGPVGTDEADARAVAEALGEPKGLRVQLVGSRDVAADGRLDGEVVHDRRRDG